MVSLIIRSVMGGICVRRVCKKKAPLGRAGLFQTSNLHQVQTIVPVELSQVFADCECEAVADHVWGGPATIAALMVTFCDGVKPLRGVVLVALPAKYAPLLSAAYCSSYVARLRRSDFIAAT